MILSSINNEKKSDYILNIAKIGILIFFSIMIIANFVPYFENTPDSYVYGLKSISIFEGSWTVSNDLLAETGKWEFVPSSWKMTVDREAIPKYTPGIPILGSISYILFGFNGLFYLGPIAAIVLLITTERIATNLFGKYVGFFTLLFVSIHGYIYDIGRHLLSDNFFVLFTLLGFYFVIKFFKTENNYWLLFSSSCLVFSSVIRASGIINFPIEILFITIYLIFRKKGIFYNNNKLYKKLSPNKVLKIILFFSIPLIIYMAFFVSFNSYYFGDPMTTFYNIPGDPWHRPGTGSFLSIFESGHNNFELIKSYSNYVLPYPIYRVEILDSEKLLDERDDELTNSLIKNGMWFVGQNNLGLITFIMLGIFLAISFFTKNRFGVISIFSIIIIVNIIFWSANHISFGRDSVMGRYMMPTIPFFSMMLGYLIISIFKINFRKNKSLLKILKIIFVLLIIGFFIIAIYSSAPSQYLKNNGLEFRDPSESLNYYPLDKEGLPENAIIVGGKAHQVVDYGFTTFNWAIGLPPLRAGFDPNNLDQGAMNSLKELISDEKPVFVFKNAKNEPEEKFRQTLFEKYGLGLKSYSNSFCKVEKIDTKVKFEEFKAVNLCYTKK